jgi:hypothetical protein
VTACSLNRNAIVIFSQVEILEMATKSPILDAFESAKTEFINGLLDDERHKFSDFTSIQEVYDATEQIQQEQSKGGSLRNLNRIQQYLDCLGQYAGVIETFVQVKPEILALIWVCMIPFSGSKQILTHTTRAR